MRVISSQFFSGTKEMTRARIMRVNSRQKRVNQIRASFVKDARRQMRVDTRSLAGALKTHVLTLFLYQLLKVKFELWLQILSRFRALGRFGIPKLLWSFRVNIQWKWQTLAIDVKCIPHHIHERKLHIYKKSIPHLWKSIQKIIWGHAFFAFFGQFR